MATERLPAYVNPRKLADGRKAYFWIRPAWASPERAKSPVEAVRRRAVRHGRTCPVESTPLGSDIAEMFKKAEALNAAFKEWRNGIEAKGSPGSVQWLFAWYREQAKFKALKHKTRKGYRECMDAIEEIAMKVGKLGGRQASLVDGPVADKLYAKARAKHGERQGAYMMQVARLVWNHASRPGYRKITGVKDNPFAGMGIVASSGTGKGNRAATRAEYNAYRAAARELGLQSMATAAALCFEGCQRVWDVFGFEDPDKRIARGIRWEGYTPGEMISLVQSKTGNPVDIPLSETITGEVVQLYPELEEELGRTERGEGGVIVKDERTGVPYTADYMLKLHRRIRDKAGLPAEIRFTSFRHGGITELGDSGTDDVRAVSGHSTLEVTRIYNKANQEKARRIAARRREYIAMVTQGSSSAED